MKDCRIKQRGAALITALVTVVLVTTMASVALWQQWRAMQTEAAELARMRAAWTLLTAHDWSRLMLIEDGQRTETDHLFEPWAQARPAAHLTGFLAANALQGFSEARVSGQIIDAQGKLNVRNLVVEAKAVPHAVDSFKKLFALLGLPLEQVDLLVSHLQRVDLNAQPAPPGAAPEDTQTPDSAPLMPQRVSELGWWGLPSETITAIAPFVTVLPTVTALNINTAPLEVLRASLPQLELASAKRLIAVRQQRFFVTVADANQVLPKDSVKFVPGPHTVLSSFFEATERLQLDQHWMHERSLLLRESRRIEVLWRDREAGLLSTTPAP